MSPTGFRVATGPGVVWRIGHAPDPWAWTPWEYAGDNGLFDGRWDDQLGKFRTVYTAQTLVGCFLEVLARLRPDAQLVRELDVIVDDDESASLYPTAEAGAVGYEWLEGRVWARGTQTGSYCFITHSDSVAYLAASGVFRVFGIAAADIGTDLLKDPNHRVLTRTIARNIYDLRDAEGAATFDGVEFRSRHGDELRMWAIFERFADSDDDRPTHITPDIQGTITPETDSIMEAFATLGLHWHDAG
jgi:hypothetical protein